MISAALRVLSIAALLVLGGGALCAAQLQNNGGGAPGQGIYESHCAACHGLDGRGNEAPNIATVPEIQNLSDAQLLHIVHDGHAGVMPAFAGILSDSQIAGVVAYVRNLQHRGGPAVQGNVAHGKALFFGAAQCSQCHMMQGRGGFLGPDLSHVPLPADDLRAAIVHPAISPTGVLTTITLKGGPKISGLVRNEDNFSIQLLDEKGNFVLLDKKDVARIDRAPAPLMPGNYGTRLSSSELQDLVAYLASQASPVPSAQRSQ